MTMDGFSNKWRDFPDYILAITKEIWEGRDIESLNRYYSDDVIVRSPMGVQHGNQAVIASTMATVHEFPDRELFGQDVIWSPHETGLLSSHRILTCGTHLNDGAFGPASGEEFEIFVIADCAAKDNQIFDEWLIRDYGGIVRQFGLDPQEFTAQLIADERVADALTIPLTPENDLIGPYKGTGNDNEWGARYAEILQQIMAKEFSVIPQKYDRAVVGHYAGGVEALSHGPVTEFWVGLRSAFPNAEFEIHHVIGNEGDLMPPRAAVRWSLKGKHEGWGSFGKPTGADVYIMGLCHAEFGPFGDDRPTVRREWALYDEIAIWKQILLHQEAGQ